MPLSARLVSGHNRSPPQWHTLALHKLCRTKTESNYYLFFTRHLQRVFLHVYLHRKTAQPDKSHRESLSPLIYPADILCVGAGNPTRQSPNDCSPV
jgi:hypothetical protein